jgi:hypothetical protein
MVVIQQPRASPPYSVSRLEWLESSEDPGGAGPRFLTASPPMGEAARAGNAVTVEVEDTFGGEGESCR